MNALTEAAKVTRVSNAVTAGTTTINSASVDTAGFDACQFTVLVGAITSGAETSLKLQGSADNTTFVDLASTSQTIADDADNQVFIADVVLPTYRYLRCVVSRATQNAEIDGILASQYRAEAEPVVHDTSVRGTKLTPAPVAA